LDCTVRHHGHKLVQLPQSSWLNVGAWQQHFQRYSYRNTTYEARQNTDLSLHGCVDQAENTLENLQTEVARDNVSEPHAYLIWFKMNKLQYRGRCGTEYTGIYMLFRILAAFHSIIQPHNTTLSQVHTSGLRSRTHPAVSKCMSLHSLPQMFCHNFFY